MEKREKDSGLTNAEADRFRSAAERLYSDDDCGFDADAPISVGDPSQGAYVQAWVWVPASELKG